jgi:FkbM family methyltransferase
VSRWENWSLSKFGKIEPTRLSPDTAQILYGDGKSLQMGPPSHYADMSCSRHELPTLVAFLNICSVFLDGKVAWDVGGNAGFYGALLGKLVGPAGKVYGFEPVPDTFKLMCANQQTAQCTNVTPMNIALSDHDGVMPMSFNPSYTSVSSLEVSEGDATIDVRVASGDRLVESGECQVPTMVKMDIEGHELKALQGMRKTLGQPECRAIVCEIHFSILASKGESDASQDRI